LYVIFKNMNMKIIRYIFLLLTATVILSCGKAPDKVFINGKIYTLDSKNTVTEAIAVKDGDIVDLGTTKDIKDKY